MKTFHCKISGHRHTNTLLQTQGFAKTLPLVVLAIFAAAAGIFVGIKTSDQSANQASTQAALNSGSSAEENALQSIQAKLKNSLVLPADYKQLPEFTLLDKNAQSVSADSLQGQWNLVFFGFTQCPDVCPLTLSILAEALNNINALDEQLPTPNVVFVSVDPKRDTPEGLKNYIEYFNPDFKALTGTLNQMYDFINPLNVVVSYTVDEEDENEYTVDHTASIMLIDPELRLRGKFNAPHTADVIATDYQTILKHLM